MPGTIIENLSTRKFCVPVGGVLLAGQLVDMLPWHRALRAPSRSSRQSAKTRSLDDRRLKEPGRFHLQEDQHSQGSKSSKTMLGLDDYNLVGSWIVFNDADWVKTTRTGTGEEASSKECRETSAELVSSWRWMENVNFVLGELTEQKGVQAACQACPSGRTTPKSGAITIEECSLLVSTPGTYLNGSLNSCVECKKGFYQTKCIACPLNTNTKGPGATSKDECTNPCEMNGPDIKHCGVNAYCLLIPETGDFDCEGKPGYNGTGEFCVDLCDGYCENEGACVKGIQTQQPSCRCMGSYTGKHCSEKSPLPS